jgi:hypothetical protein
MITRLGELSLLDVVPLLAELQAALAGAQAFAVPELQAKLAGLANVLAAITIAPPALGATITAALSTVASLQASIGGPTVTLQATAIASLIATLELQLAALTLTISVPNPSVSAYVYEGESGSIGVELQGAVNADLPGAPGAMTALILATTSPSAWDSMGVVFAVGGT